MAERYAKITRRRLRKDYQLQDTIERILAAFPPLQALDQGGLGWGELQRIEAGILLDVMTWLRETEGIPTLPVHDSLIVPERHVQRTAWALYHRLCGVTGTHPRLTIHRDSEPEEQWREDRYGDGVAA